MFPLPDLSGLLGQPDHQPREPRFVHVLFDDGVVSRVQVSGGGDFVLPRPGRILSEEEYTERQSAMRAAHDARVAELLEAEGLQRQRDYEDLLSAGVPERMAGRLSGHVRPS